MDPTKEKPVVKKLPCGGHAIYGIDFKSKQQVQIGYIGANLNLEAYLPPGITLQDIKK
jgi:hypothetical protein